MGYRGIGPAAAPGRVARIASLLASSPRAIYRHGRRALGRHGDADLYYVVPRANWAVDRTGDSITRHVRDRFGWRTHLTATPHLLVDHILHYGELWSFVNSLGSRRNRRNTVVATVFHANRRDDFPELKAATEQLIAHAHVPSRIVTTCRLMEQRLCDWGIAPARIVRIPLGVDLALFRSVSAERRRALRRQHGVPAGAICVGSFQKDGQGWGEGLSPKLEKGPDVFLAVIRRLRQQYPLHVLLTGPARGYVTRGLDALGVPYRHELVYEPQRLADCYRCLDVYLAASREEGGPLSVLEALATGIPVVSTRVGLAADVIQHGENGLLAEPEDAETLAALVAQLIDAPSLRGAVSERALHGIAAYDWEVIAARYWEELYRPLLDERAGRC